MLTVLTFNAQGELAIATDKGGSILLSQEDAQEVLNFLTESKDRQEIEQEEGKDK